jgi:hypothetical protein
MTDLPPAEPMFVRATRAAYDTVAVDYAELLRDELAAKPVDRALLALFAELVRGGGPVADLGCGPGHDISLDAYRLDPDRVTAQLRAIGLTVHLRAERTPEPQEKVPQTYLLARRGDAVSG